MSLTLVKPSEAYAEEIRAFKHEFAESGLQFNGVSGLQAVEDVSAWINRCRNMENRAYAEPLGYVAGEQFMLVDGQRILGMIAFRHYLNESLEKVGGHIGYSIRPCEQRKGYAKAMLALCLNKCRAFGLDKVLITCDEQNIASRKTILAHGGLFAGKVFAEGHYSERYWVPCGEMRIRKAILGDESTLAMILCESWKAAYKDIIPPEEMALRTDIEKRTIRFRALLENGAGTNFIASYGGNSCGMLAFGKGRDDDLPFAAEVFSIHALEAVWGKGVGHAMLTFALAELTRQGYQEILLWVFEENDRARKCYERHGFVEDGTAHDSGLGNAIEIRYRKTLDKRRNPA